MFGWLLLLFTVVPAVELYLLIQLGQWIGALQTVAIIVGTGLLGAALAKREGLAVVRQLHQDTLNGVPPTDRLMEGVLVLLGGAFLITPGVITDLTGFLLIAPPTRRWLVPRVKAWAARRLLLRGVTVGPAEAGPAAREARARRAREAVQEDGGGGAASTGDADPHHGFDHPVR